PAFAVIPPLAGCCGVFGREACVGVLCNPIRKRFVGVANAAHAAPDKIRASAVLAIPLQCAGVEFENARGVIFEMDDHYKGSPCAKVKIRSMVQSGSGNFCGSQMFTGLTLG